MLRIEFVQGDITEQEVDAIVNAANRGLLGGGGVDGAIHSKGGRRIFQECKRLRETRLPQGLPTGEAVATTAGDLKAKHVIHTVGPVYAQAKDPAADLRRCHLSALKVADTVGARSVAFPAISTGIYGYPLDEAARVAVAAVREASTQVEVVRFVLFDRKTYESFRKAAG